MELSKLNKIYLLINTLKYLKLKQIQYRGYYFIKNRFFKKKYPLFLDSCAKDTKFENFINSYKSYKGNNEFEFLNLTKKFDKIDWNYKEFGKLWTYNLNYFDYLNQEDFDKNEGLRIINDFIENIRDIKDGLEPYPISLRGINWIKFLTKYEIDGKKINDSLYAQYYILLDNLEYHLLGNHLLENGFSLLWGGVYFNDKKLLNKAKEILYEELNEQILKDGGHFELSAMYHQIMLFRILDCINLIDNEKWKNVNEEFLEFLKSKTILMLSWLKNITFENGDIPHFNDSTNAIAPTTKKLIDYANKLNINSQFPILNSQLKDSGYRKITRDKYECIIDIGNIAPDYIPGHAHADTFNFELYIKNSSQFPILNYPFIIDTGISTYEANKIREYERSTKAHNTVEVNNTNSSEVWGSFRVANRAKVIDLVEKDNYIKATHNGYKKFGVYHTREWEFFDDKIAITDTLNKKANAVFRLYFHPKIDKEEIKKRIKAKHFLIKECLVSFGYNKRVRSKVLEIEFYKELKVEITL